MTNDRVLVVTGRFVRTGTLIAPEDNFENAVLIASMACGMLQHRRTSLPRRTRIFDVIAGRIRSESGAEDASRFYGDT